MPSRFHQAQVKQHLYSSYTSVHNLRCRQAPAKACVRLGADDVFHCPHILLQQMYITPIGTLEFSTLSQGFGPAAPFNSQQVTLSKMQCRSPGNSWWQQKCGSSGAADLPGAKLCSEFAPVRLREGALRDARDSHAAAQLVDARLQQLLSARLDDPGLNLTNLKCKGLLYTQSKRLQHMLFTEGSHAIGALIRRSGQNRVSSAVQGWQC